MNRSGNLYSLIQKNAPEDVNTTLITTETGLSYSWSDMDHWSGGYAALLRESGLAKGDRVAVQVEKSPQSLFLYLACLRSGLIYLPMNTAYHADEVAHLLGNAEPAAIVADPGAEVLKGDPGVSRRWTLTSDGTGSFTEEAASRLGGDFETVASEPGDTAAILYTSGTTGKPKGAMLSHRNLAANGLALRDSWGFTSRDVLLHALPLFHAHGLFVACHTVLLAGARFLWMTQFDRDRVIASLPRATVFMGVPTYYTRLLSADALSASSCRTIRLFVSGSAPLLEETFTSFRNRTGQAILERYGMTETGMNTSNPYDGERRAGTVGLPLPGVSVRVVGEDGGTLSAGKVGMLQVRGENVFGGYWRMPEKTAEDFTADHWFITGDLAVIEDQGYIRLVGRARDLIITGGYNVYPKEVELVLDAIDGIAESAVIGVPHPDFGEAVVAVVQCPEDRPPPEAGTLIAIARQKLANYKVPKQVVFVRQLPRNAMGKVQKMLLRQQIADNLLGG
ncbi:MAG: AMP-binding protein [Alphaproteobacteria bacterium]